MKTIQTMMDDRKVLGTLFLFALVDILGFSLVLPLFPYLSTHFGMSPSTVGFLQASNALAQLISVPIIGGLADHYGRKPLLMLCVLSTLLSFLILAAADSAFWVFFSRILDGLLGGNIALAQTYIADVTTKENRARGMGLIGAAFGLGFIVGPALGGFLVHRDPSYPALAAATLTAINLVCMIFFLPESLPLVVKATPSPSSSPLDPLFRSLKEVRKPRLALLMFLRFHFMVVFTLFESSFGFFNRLLGLSASESAYALSFFALCFAAVQGGGIKALLNRLTEDEAIRYSLQTLAIAFAIYSNNFDWRVQLILLIPLGVGSGILNSLLSSRFSNEIEPALHGSALGISAALSSLSRIVAPTLGGLLMELVNVPAPFMACAALCVLLFALHHRLRFMPRITLALSSDLPSPRLTSSSSSLGGSPPKETHVGASATPFSLLSRSTLKWREEEVQHGTPL